MIFCSFRPAGLLVLDHPLAVSWFITVSTFRYSTFTFIISFNFTSQILSKKKNLFWELKHFELLRDQWWGPKILLSALFFGNKSKALLKWLRFFKFLRSFKNRKKNLTESLVFTENIEGHQISILKIALCL